MNRKRIFLAAPISGFSNEEECNEYRDKILDLVQYLRENSFTVYSEVEKVTGKSDYDSPGTAVENDFKKICESDVFLLLHPRKIQTSSLIELGYAYAKKKRIVIVGPKTALPYLALGLPSVNSNILIIDASMSVVGIFEQILYAING